MTENALVIITFLFGLFVFALLLALAAVAWLALKVMRMCERYRADRARARVAAHRGTRLTDRKIKLP